MSILVLAGAGVKVRALVAGCTLCESAPSHPLSTGACLNCGVSRCATMCLILLAYRSHPEVEILLAGNRDEFYRRPAAPPALVSENPRIFAGQDLEAGGTWMGRNEHGLVAALTNRRTADPPPPEARSRGEIVMGLLRKRTAWDAAAWLNDRTHSRYRPYSVLFGAQDAFYYFSPSDPPIAGDTPAPLNLRPGMYALSNSALDDTSWPKVERSLGFLRGHQDAGGEHLLGEIQRFLCDPTPADDQPTLVAGEEIHGAMGAVFIRDGGLAGTAGGYGTVSSSIITVGGNLGDRYYFADSADMVRAFGAASRGGRFQTPFHRIELTQATAATGV